MKCHLTVHSGWRDSETWLPIRKILFPVFAIFQNTHQFDFCSYKEAALVFAGISYHIAHSEKNSYCTSSLLFVLFQCWQSLLFITKIIFSFRAAALLMIIHLNYVIVVRIGFSCGKDIALHITLAKMKNLGHFFKLSQQKLHEKYSNTYIMYGILNHKPRASYTSFSAECLII